MKLTIPRAPDGLSLNRKISRRWAMYHAKQLWESEVRAALGRERPKFKQPTIKITCFFKYGRRRDKDNFALVPKFICDGLVKTGVIIDDNHKAIELLPLELCVDFKNPRVEIEITEIVEAIV